MKPVKDREPLAVQFPLIEAIQQCTHPYVVAKSYAVQSIDGVPEGYFLARFVRGGATYEQLSVGDRIKRGTLLYLFRRQEPASVQVILRG